MSFGPLSPTSEKTMIRHKQEHDVVKQSESEASASEDEWSDRYRDNQFKRSSGHRRQSSDTTHDRSPNRDGEGRRRRRRHYDDSDDDVEVLPDRFDSHGRPLDGSSSSRRSRFVTRSGEFHRPAQRPGDMEVHGGWQLGGTDPEQIERLVRTVTGVLEGRKSWVSVIGEVLGGDVLPQLAGPLAGPLAGVMQAVEGSGRDDDDDDGLRRRRRRR